MRLFTRRKAEPAVKSVPPYAHGRRNIDGGYFTIYRCQFGHHTVGNAGSRPDEPCRECRMTKEPEETVWSPCTPREAHDFLFELEGLSMYNGIGFTLTEAVRNAAA